MATGRKLKNGTKNDEEKVRLELLPYDALLELGKLWTLGAKKYNSRNWEKGIKYSRIFAAMMRHAWAFWNREDKDSETGLSHMIHATWNALALTTYIIRGMTQFDDRPRKENNQ